MKRKLNYEKKLNYVYIIVKFDKLYFELKWQNCLYKFDL